MQYLLTGRQMKAVDLYNIEEIGIPSLALMERAALETAREAERLCPEGGRVLAVCGTGNNGADGLAAVRMLFLHGRRAEALILGNAARATRENRIQQEILKKLGIPVYTADNFPEYPIEGRRGTGKDPEEPYSLILDALFGIGLSRPPEGDAAEAVCRINRAGERGIPVVSVDIPSGISAETGQILGTAVRADVTVTFGYEKLGTILYPGTRYAGRRIVADIGFAQPPDMGEAVRGFRPGERGNLPGRPQDGNKGTFGRVFLAAGSAGMSGAAYLSAKAAGISGAGLVQIHTERENVPILQTLLPEAVITVSDGGKGAGQAEENGEACSHEEAGGRGLLRRAAVLVAGPGLSVKPSAGRLLRELLKERKALGIPCVLDADALNILARERDLFDHLEERTILTPHMGEMARLTGRSVGELKADPVGAAREFHKKYGVVCVLKDARTVVASGKGIYVNLSGNDGMATGGAGDVLSGILGGLLAGGMEPEEAAETGVYLHGLAGDAAAERLGRRSMMAGDILDAAVGIFRDWERHILQETGEEAYGTVQPHGGVC
ncbi:MAG: NAD(P)H-hydrate dehydratase [Lachnospiraceae bacterium]|nr:NAD(P)H-hydrate dehydratase [Lachnospiraceae bacterium]